MHTVIINCPYCGSIMEFVHKAIRGKTRIGYMVCPECKARSPQIDTPFRFTEGAVDIERLENQVRRATDE